MKGVYERAFTTLVLNLQYALKDEWIKSEEINGSLQTLDDLVQRSKPQYVKVFRDGIGDRSIPNGNYEFNTYYCPNPRCDEELDYDKKPNYCPCCGQRLEYEDE